MVLSRSQKKVSKNNSNFLRFRMPTENIFYSQDGKRFIFLTWFPYTQLAETGMKHGALSFEKSASEGIVTVDVGQKNCIVWELYPSFYYGCLSSLWE